MCKRIYGHDPEQPGLLGRTYDQPSQQPEERLQQRVRGYLLQLHQLDYQEAGPWSVRHLLGVALGQRVQPLLRPVKFAVYGAHEDELCDEQRVVGLPLWGSYVRL
jgi:hypothetical protein